MVINYQENWKVRVFLELITKFQIPKQEFKYFALDNHGLN